MVRNMKKILPFSGLCTALVTPFVPDGSSVDAQALVRLIEFQIAGGADAVLILGTTGEASTVRDDERREILSLAVRTAAGRIPIVAGCGSNDTAHAVRLAREAEDEGCSALLSVTPYYNKTTPSGLVRHYEEIAGSTGLPLILYNVPNRTGVDIPLSVYEKLARHPRIAGVKEASGDIRKIARLTAEYGDSFAVWTGNDAETVPVLAMGGAGVFSVVSNLFPEEVSAVCRRMREERHGEAVRIWKDLLPLADALFSEVNPIPVKEACAMLGLCSAAVRLPLVGMSEENRRKLKDALEAFLRKREKREKEDAERSAPGR